MQLAYFIIPAPQHRFTLVWEKENDVRNLWANYCSYAAGFVACMSSFSLLYWFFIGNWCCLEFLFHKTVLRDYGADWPRCKAHPPWHAFFLWRLIFCKVESGKSPHTVSLNSVVRSLSDLFFLLFLPGIFEKCTANLCQAECWNKICTRDEWNFGTALLCISEWSRW